MRDLLVTSCSQVSGLGLEERTRGSRASLRPMLNALRFLRCSRRIESLIAQAMETRRDGDQAQLIGDAPASSMLEYCLEPRRLLARGRPGFLA